MSSSKYKSFWSTLFVILGHSLVIDFFSHQIWLYYDYSNYKLFNSQKLSHTFLYVQSWHSLIS